MKKIANEGRGTVAYIHNMDVNILSSMYKVVNPVLFRERSIVLDNCDKEGMYRIEAPEAISYVSRLPYILDMDDIESMSSTELNELAKEAAEDLESLNAILAKLCDGKKKLSRSDKQKLESISGVDQQLIEDIVAEAKKGKKSGRKKIRRMDFYLKQQMNHYVAQIQAVQKARG